MKKRYMHIYLKKRQSSKFASILARSQRLYSVFLISPYCLHQSSASATWRRDSTARKQMCSIGAVERAKGIEDRSWFRLLGLAKYSFWEVWHLAYQYDDTSLLDMLSLFFPLVKYSDWDHQAKQCRKFVDVENWSESDAAQSSIK